MRDVEIDAKESASGGAAWASRARKFGRAPSGVAFVRPLAASAAERALACGDAPRARRVGRARGARAYGFTLVEVVVALLLVSVAVVAAVRFNQDNQDALAMLRNQETAMLLARARAFELVQDGVNAATDKEGDFEGEHAEFVWEAEARSTGVEDYYRLVVRVRWKNPRAGSVRIERLFTD